MKKFIALGVALVMLFFSFAATTEVGVAENGVSVCSDLKPKPEPYDQALGC